MHKKTNFLLKNFMLFPIMMCLYVPQISYAYSGITILLSSPLPAYLEFVDAFREALITTKNTALRVNVIELQEYEAPKVAENSELVIALGEPALKAASKLKLTTPVLAVFTPLPTFNTLLASSERTHTNFSAITSDQPYARQMLLMKTILPDVKKVGVMLAKMSLQQKELIKTAAEKKAIHISVETINEESQLIPTLQQLLNNNDAVMAIPDPMIYTRETAQPIFLTTYRYKKPVFGYSQSYVSAGALAAVYTKTNQLAKQAAEIAVKRQSLAGQLPSPQTPRYFSVSINYQVARLLNITVLEEDEVHQKLLEVESNKSE